MALTPYQIRVISDGASAYWPLDDPSGTVARDLAGASLEGGLEGSDKAYLQARSGIARSGAIRSNYVFPLVGVITVGGVDLTDHVRYGTLRVTMAMNEEPDTCSFEVDLTDSAVEAALVVGADVLIGLGGPAENALFGGRILTTQTTRRQAYMPSVRSVMCADYLQVLDSEYLITYDWPPQSASTTIHDLFARFTNKHASAVAISMAGVEPSLPSHATVAVANERFSTVLRRLVTMFPAGGGFYIDPLKVLHVWAGVSEPFVTNPSPLTLENPMLKAFAETVDGAQQRDAAIVEGMRTTAPLGLPDRQDVYTIPVADASIFDAVTGTPFEVRVGTQRLRFEQAEGPWLAPAGTPMTTTVTADVAFNPDPGVESNTVTIFVASVVMLTGRTLPWVLIDEQYLFVGSWNVGANSLLVPRTGFGAPIGPIKTGANVTVTDSISSGSVTGRYDMPGQIEPIRPQPKDSEVVMVVRSSTAPAIHEHIVQDGRFSRSGAAARGAQEVADFRERIVSIQFESDDWNAKPGRLQAYDLAEPVVAPMVGEFMILTAELTWPVWGLPPRRTCQAAEVHAANIVDAWLVDRR